MNVSLKAGEIIRQGYTGDFLVTGGTQYYTRPGDHTIYKISRAEVLASMMIDRYQVPSAQVHIIGTEGKGNTLGNVANTIEYFMSNGVPSRSTIGILSNTWHIPRSLLMFLNDPFFCDHKIEISPLFADEILLQMNHHYAQWVNAFNSHPKMNQRHQAELQGVHDFCMNTYNPLGS